MVVDVLPRLRSESGVICNQARQHVVCDFANLLVIGYCVENTGSNVLECGHFNVVAFTTQTRVFETTHVVNSSFEKFKRTECVHGVLLLPSICMSFGHLSIGGPFVTFCYKAVNFILPVAFSRALHQKTPQCYVMFFVLV